MGWTNSMPEVSATPSTVGAATNRLVHAVCVFKSRAKRVRSGTWGNKGK
jgi:hypothetical protein